MILQNYVFSEKSEYRELYYRALDTVCCSDGNIMISAGDMIDTCTYMNSFDVGAWKKYTDIRNFYFCMDYEGEGRISLICEQRDGKRHVVEKELSAGKCEIEFPKEFNTGIVYFTLTARNEVKIFGARIETKEKEKRQCKIALIICTYKRKESIENIVRTLKMNEESETLCDWLNVVVIDNASELENCYGQGIQVYHNRNTGGSGGFSRGMDEVVKRLTDYPATHVVLMDDDASLEFESIVRLKALLSYVKDLYIQEPVAGRMFRTDNPVVQYTALEVWNGGDLRHIGWNQDMTLKENLWSMNDNTGGEYGGWWFECYPIEFVKENRPLPFFLHCDDVEYGLRHGGTPIILNGIQVWHETYEYRQSPVMVYYDTRNSMLLNALRGHLPADVNALFGRIKKLHIAKDYLVEWMLIRGIYDYCKGLQWLFKVDGANYNRWLKKRKKGCRIYNHLFLRITIYKYRTKKNTK